MTNQPPPPPPEDEEHTAIPILNLRNLEKNPMLQKLMLLSTNVEYVIDAVANLFKAHELLGFQHPVQMFQEVMHRFNKMSISEALADPDLPDTLRTVLSDIQKREVPITPDEATELMRKIHGDEQPAVSAADDDHQGGMYL